MAWRIELERRAVKELDKLDPPAARRILRYLHERLAPLDDPRSLGEALRGSDLGEFWKYRVGDYRIIAALLDQRLVVLVVRIGRRDAVYRRPLSAGSRWSLGPPGGPSIRGPGRLESGRR